MDTASEFSAVFAALREQIGRLVVGCDAAVENLLLSFLAGGHVLIESAPGLGKTLLAKSLAECLELKFARVQFTPDLMPADIVGTSVVLSDERGQRLMTFQPGPVFTQLLLADEITRSTPKTQSALLEAMQEHRVTTGGTTHVLPEPFFVVATQAPAGAAGTYPLPEAQRDRFLMKLELGYPDGGALREIGRRTTTGQTTTVTKVVDAARAVALQQQVRAAAIADAARDYAIRLVLATQPERADAPAITRRYLRCGSSPRGAQGLVLTAKVRALAQGRAEATVADVRGVAHPVLGHRLILNFEAEAERMAPAAILDGVLAALPA